MGGETRPRSERRGNRLARLAERQHGVVSREQLSVELGLSQRVIDLEIRAGRLQRMHRGVFAVGHRLVSHKGRCNAALLACGDGALLSHRSAAWLWGIARTAPAAPAVTTPAPRMRKAGIAVHRSGSLVAADIAEREGMAVTAPARTMLDLAGESRPYWVSRWLERCEELRIFDLAEMEEVLTRNRGHHGFGRLRRALALYRPPRFTRSRLERRFLALLERHGVPPPSTGYSLIGYELDFYWPEQRLCVELDTYVTHGSQAAFERDRRRDAELRLAGVEVERITDKRLDDEPGEVFRSIKRLLARPRSSFPTA